jgi:hypothetical protein
MVNKIELAIDKVEETLYQELRIVIPGYKMPVLLDALNTGKVFKSTKENLEIQVWLDNNHYPHWMYLQVRDNSNRELLVNKSFPL